jgi:hypothetical protein
MTLYLSVSDVLFSGKYSKKENKNWKKLILMMWNEIVNHRYGPMFTHPVKEEKAPGYYSIIKRPMDLLKVKQRVREGVGSPLLDFSSNHHHQLDYPDYRRIPPGCALSVS